MEKTRYKWKQTTLGDFEDYCLEHPNATYFFSYYQQDSSIDSPSTAVYKAQFSNVIILHSPRRVILKNGNNYVMFMCIDSVYIASKNTELSQPFLIVCNSFEGLTEKDRYTIIVQPNG